MDESIRDTRRSGLRTAILLLLVPVFVGVGMFLQSVGQEKIREVRTLERIPLTSVNGSLPGPTELSGRVVKPSGASLVASHWTNTPCIWYRAVKEVETRDSEGNTSWSEVFSETRGIPFDLVDPTGSIGVTPGPRWLRAEAGLATNQGDERFTEYRIEPDDALNIVGIRALEKDEIIFPEDGAIDHLGPSHRRARSSRAILSTFLVIDVPCIAYAKQRPDRPPDVQLLGFAIVVGSVAGLLVAGSRIMMHEASWNPTVQSWSRPRSRTASRHAVSRSSTSIGPATGAI